MLIHATTAELLKIKEYTIIIGNEGRTGIQKGRQFWLKGVQQVRYYAMKASLCTDSRNVKSLSINNVGFRIFTFKIEQLRTLYLE